MLSMPGGVTAVRTARGADATVIGAPLLPSARDVDDDRRLRDLRKADKVSAILHSGYPVRFWDKDIGPDEPHLFDAADLRDLTPQPGGALREAGFDDAVFDISADGRFLVTTWRVTGPEATERSVLLRVDLASGERRVIADDPDADLEQPAISPDGSAIAFTRETITTPDRAPRMTLQYLRFGDQPVSVAEAWDRRPTSLTWSSDGTSLVVTADQGGRAPVFLVELSTSTVTQLTDDDFAYTDVVAAPGGVLYALRSSYAAPPHPVRIDPGGAITVLPCVDLPTLPGTLTEVTAAAADGTTVRSWLVLPEDAAPGPAGVVDPRRAAGQLEQLVMAMEPVAAGRAGLRGAAAGSGAVDRLRTGIHPAWLGSVGRTAVRRFDGRHRRGVCSPAHRCDPGRRDGRLVRRLHGQLDGRPHRTGLPRS